MSSTKRHQFLLITLYLWLFCHQTKLTASRSAIHSIPVASPLLIDSGTSAASLLNNNNNENNNNNNNNSSSTTTTATSSLRQRFTIETNSIQRHNVIINPSLSDRRSLKRVFLSNRTVTCNDGSQAGFYLRKNPNSKKWIVFLEGGWHCYDTRSCRARWLRLRHLMTSSQWPETRDVGGILSPLPDENPYWHGANHVLVPYCSSDSWSGTRATPESRENNWRFMGALILRQVIADLIPLGLGRVAGAELLLVGSSAGGLGVMLNLDRITKYLLNERNLLVTVRGVSDSGWFLDRQPYTPSAVASSDAVRQGWKMWQGLLPDECVNQHVNEPWRCYFGYRLYPTLKAPLFVFQWLFDEAQMRADNVGAPVTPQQWNYIHEMGGALRSSLDNVTAVFAPSCIGHAVLSKRDWVNIKIDDISLPAALRCWEHSTRPRRKRHDKLKRSTEATLHNTQQQLERRRHQHQQRRQQKLHTNNQSDKNNNNNNNNNSNSSNSNKLKNDNENNAAKHASKKHRKNGNAHLTHEEREERKRRRHENQKRRQENRERQRQRQHRKQRKNSNAVSLNIHDDNHENNLTNENLQYQHQNNDIYIEQRRQKTQMQRRRHNNGTNNDGVKKSASVAGHGNKRRRRKHGQQHHFDPERFASNQRQLQFQQEQPYMELHRKHVSNNDVNRLRRVPRVPEKCALRLLERCSWPQCNHSCPTLTNPLTGEEVRFLELLTSFGLDIEAVAAALGVDMHTLNNMDRTELVNLLTQQVS